MSISYRLEERDESLESTLKIARIAMSDAIVQLRSNGLRSIDLRRALEHVEDDLKMFKEMRANLAAAYLEKTRGT